MIFPILIGEAENWSRINGSIGVIRREKPEKKKEAQG